MLFRAGRSLAELGMVRAAVGYFEDLTEQASSRLGGDHPDTLTSRNNLAGAYESAGDLGRAIPLFEQTHTDMERVLGPDHPDTLTVRANLEAAREQQSQHLVTLSRQTRDRLMNLYLDETRAGGVRSPPVATSRVVRVRSAVQAARVSRAPEDASRTFGPGR